MLIGVTGQIGAGKSTAAKILASLGGAVVDADLIGKQVVESNPQLLAALAKKFGADVLTPRGNLRRKLVAQRAFASEQGRAALNRIVHPYLLKELWKEVRARSKTHKFIVIDAALLLFWGLDHKTDLTLVIHAGRETRFARLAARGIDRSDAAARQRNQLPYAEFRSRADRLILNNGTVENLRQKLENWVKKILPNRPQ